MASAPQSDITVYGIVNCDTVKRARAWLAQHRPAVRFHDFKRQGVPPERLDAWIEALGWERLVNRQGTTWRRLEEAERAGICDVASARRGLLAHPSLIKRPVVEWGDRAITVGFDPDDWQTR
jgi:Spx/MgsR family transcriptional regulator